MKPEEILNRTGPFLIRDVLTGGRKTDIFIGETGTIEAVGNGIARKYESSAAFVIDGSFRVALPGLVNTHTHAAMTLLRGYADDMVLGDWLTQKIWPLEAHLTGDDVYWGTRLACLEMIRTGTTAFNDMYFFMEDAARAVDEAGVRALLCHGFIDLDDAGKREAECKATESLVSSIKGMNNPRIRAAVGPHAVYTVSPEGLRWCAGFAKEEGIPTHIHLSETEKEVVDCVDRYGKRPPALLDECGILTKTTIAAHCCWLNDDDCLTVGHKGVNVSFNPSSNMKLATNRALPYRELVASGANVCLGTDGCASNNNLDMFEEMKISALLQKFYWNNPTVLPAGDAVRMATGNGCRALGFGPGTLQPGSPADIILVSTDKTCNTPLHNQDSNLVYSCNGGAVATTICNGRVLMYERSVLHEDAILEGASRAAQSLVQRTLSS
ncbi:MAG TPA: amidohydrolase family protein [Methanoregulaceae archaeon]|nr:amidohydrolase family protein [Methanoregulaceae archaeon]